MLGCRNVPFTAFAAGFAAKADLELRSSDGSILNKEIMSQISESKIIFSLARVAVQWHITAF